MRFFSLCAPQVPGSASSSSKSAAPSTASNTTSAALPGGVSEISFPGPRKTDVPTSIVSSASGPQITTRVSTKPAASSPPSASPKATQAIDETGSVLKTVPVAEPTGISSSPRSDYLVQTSVPENFQQFPPQDPEPDVPAEDRAHGTIREYIQTRLALPEGVMTAVNTIRCIRTTGLRRIIRIARENMRLIDRIGAVLDDVANNRDTDFSVEQMETASSDVVAAVTCIPPNLQKRDAPTYWYGVYNGKDNTTVGFYRDTTLIATISRKTDGNAPNEIVVSEAVVESEEPVTSTGYRTIVDSIVYLVIVWVGGHILQLL